MYPIHYEKIIFITIALFLFKSIAYAGCLSAGGNFKLTAVEQTVGNLIKTGMVQLQTPIE